MIASSSGGVTPAGWGMVSRDKSPSRSPTSLQPRKLAALPPGASLAPPPIDASFQVSDILNSPNLGGSHGRLAPLSHSAKPPGSLTAEILKAEKELRSALSHSQPDAPPDPPQMPNKAPLLAPPLPPPPVEDKASTPQLAARGKSLPKMMKSALRNHGAVPDTADQAQEPKEGEDQANTAQQSLALALQTAKELGNLGQMAFNKFLEGSISNAQKTEQAPNISPDSARYNEPVTRPPVRRGRAFFSAPDVIRDDIMRTPGKAERHKALPTLPQQQQALQPPPAMLQPAPMLPAPGGPIPLARQLPRDSRQAGRLLRPQNFPMNFPIPNSASQQFMQQTYPVPTTNSFQYPASFQSSFRAPPSQQAQFNPQPQVQQSMEEPQSYDFLPVNPYERQASVASTVRRRRGFAPGQAPSQYQPPAAQLLAPPAFSQSFHSGFNSQSFWNQQPPPQGTLRPLAHPSSLPPSLQPYAANAMMRQQQQQQQQQLAAAAAASVQRMQMMAMMSGMMPPSQPQPMYLPAQVTPYEPLPPTMAEDYYDDYAYMQSQQPQHQLPPSLMMPNMTMANNMRQPPPPQQQQQPPPPFMPSPSYQQPPPPGPPPPYGSQANFSQSQYYR